MGNSQLCSSEYGNNVNGHNLCSEETKLFPALSAPPDSANLFFHMCIQVTLSCTGVPGHIPNVHAITGFISLSFEESPQPQNIIQLMRAFRKQVKCKFLMVLPDPIALPKLAQNPSVTHSINNSSMRTGSIGR